MVTVIFKLTDSKLESSDYFSLNEGKGFTLTFPSIFLMSAQGSTIKFKSLKDLDTL